mmetsp:Transcript_12398/g.20267  ORF Transcript_12398/g.20267 Transcript_12398/m.20267 type:complete len:244 (+) Transcript_12398:91-822(+)
MNYRPELRQHWLSLHVPPVPGCLPGELVDCFSDEVFERNSMAPVGSTMGFGSGASSVCDGVSVSLWGSALPIGAVPSPEAFAKIKTFKHISKYSRDLQVSNTNVKNWPPRRTNVVHRSSRYAWFVVRTAPAVTSSGEQIFSMHLNATGHWTFGMCNTRWVSSESKDASVRSVRPSSSNTLIRMPRSNARAKVRKHFCKRCCCSSGLLEEYDASPSLSRRTKSNSAGTCSTGGTPRLTGELQTF